MTTLAQTASLTSCTGETTHFAVLMHGVADPLDAGIVPDFLVVGINQNDFVILLSRVLVDPVRVENT